MARTCRASPWLVTFLMAEFATVFGLKDGDCLRPDAAASFVNTPGGYDPLKGIESTHCASLCAGIPMPYAGIQYGKFCLCSNDVFVEKAVAAKDEVCDKHPFAVRFYFSSLFTPIENIRVMPSQSLVAVGEEVSFYIATSSGKDAHVVIDFGDGSEGINGSLSMEPKYIYWKPGRYNVQVMAKPYTAHDIYTAFAHTTVVVTTSPEEQHIAWACPVLVEPNVKFQCRLDVLKGTDLSLEFMPGDGTGSKSRNIPDVYPTIVGERVPQFRTQSVVLSEENAVDSAILPNARVLHKGTVFAFQGFGAVQGKLDMLLLRPACLGCSFEDDIAKCEGSTGLCLSKVACVDFDMCPKRDVSEVYKIMAVVPIQVKDGYFIHKLQKTLPVEAGDIFGFTTAAGRLAFRNVPMEESDLGKRNGLKGQAVRTDDLTMKEQRFLVSALVNTPLNLTFEYKYGDAGAYEVAINVKNRYHEQVVRQMADVSSQQKLTAFKLDISQSTVPTGAEVTATAKMFGGSDLTMIWNFGDGHVEKQDITSINVDIFYVRDGAMNEYALRFSVPVKGNTVEFSWQNLKSQQQTLNYKIEIQVDRPEAMNPPKLDIPSRGQLPATPTTFVVSLPCTGRESAEVKVTISVNVSSAGDPSRITVVKIPRKKVCLKDERFIEKVITMVPTEPSQAVDDDDDENIDEMEEDSEDAEVEDNNTVLILGKGGNSISDKTVLLSSSRKNSANTTMIMDAATTPVQVSGDRNPMILAVGGAAVFVAMAFMLATTVCYVKTKKMRQATQGNIIIQAAADKYFHEWTTASSTIKTQNGGYGVITSSNLTPQQGQRLLRVGSPVASTVASYSSFRKASPPLAPSPVPPPAVSHLTLKSVGTLNSSAGQYSTIQDISASRSSLLSEQLNELAVDSACLTLVELLNEGAFGRVYYAHLSTFPAVDVQPVFVKTVKEQASAGQIEMFMQEGMMLYGMNHANVLTVFGTCLNLEGQPALIYPAMAEGNLKQFLRRSKFSQTECGHHCLTTQDLVDMGVQIAEGLMYLHRRFFLHKDVAARNCLLDERLHVKLADNSLSRDLFPDDYHCLGDGENRPVAWLAIESLNIREFTPASDLWMFGVTLWELLTLGQQPFAEIDSFEMVNYLNSGYRLAQPVNCPDELFEVMERCWVACPGERLTLPQVVRTLANFYNQLGSYI